VTITEKVHESAHRAIRTFTPPKTDELPGTRIVLRREVRHVVLHEIAHHFGISDERLIELDRY